MHLAIAFSVRRLRPASFVKIAALAVMLPIASTATAQYIPSATNAYTQSLMSSTGSGANTPYFPAGSYTDFSTLQAVDSNGYPPFVPNNSAGTVTVVGIVLNNPSDMLNTAPDYNTIPYNLGGQWQIFIQAYSDANGANKIGGDPSDFGGAEIWMGQMYSNLLFNLPIYGPNNYYNNSQWGSVVANLSNPPLITGGTVALQAGDVVAVNSLTYEYEGMVNLNQQHFYDNPISITVLEQNASLPKPTETTLSQLMDPYGNFYFDPTRQTGAENLKDTLVQLDGVRLVSGTWAPNNTVVVTDGQQRLMTVNIGNNPNLMVAPTGAFNIVGIEDQESNLDLTPTNGYTLWLTDSANVTPIQPASNGVFQWTGSGSWSTAGNWQPAGMPQNAGDTAIFAGALAVGGTVTLDGAQKAGGLIFGNVGQPTNGYTISPGASGSLTLDNSGSGSFVLVTGENHAIAAPLTINDNLVATVDTGAGLAISEGISQGSSGLSLTLQGGGTLVLGGTSDYNGGTTVANGTLIVEEAAALADGSSLTVGRAAGEFSSVIAAGSTSAVPEPGTLALSGGGIGCVLLICRARTRRKSHD